MFNIIDYMQKGQVPCTEIVKLYYQFDQFSLCIKCNKNSDKFDDKFDDGTSKIFPISTYVSIITSNCPSAT